MTTAPKMLILLAGMPGSGKSTVAQGLGRELGFPVVDKDVILSALLEAGVPEPLAHPAAYQVMFDLGENLLQQGSSVVLDSPAGLPETVRVAHEVCRRTSAQLIPVLCVADQDVRNQRVASRTSLPSQPVGVSKTPGNARERFLHMPADAIEVDTIEPVDVVVGDVLVAIHARSASMP